ncbi:MAG: hypothetical protein NXI31_02490 [bacterium]|nr:hypothetical protein [bacterium]
MRSFVGLGVLTGLLAAGCSALPSDAPAEGRPSVGAQTGGSSPFGGEFAIAFVFEPALPAPSRFVVVHESGLLRECGSGRTGCEVRLPPGPATLCYELNGEPAEFVFVAEKSREFVIKAPSPGLSGSGEARR